MCRDFEYEEDNKILIFGENCVKCKNYDFCETVINEHRYAFDKCFNQLDEEMRNKILNEARGIKDKDTVARLKVGDTCIGLDCSVSLTKEKCTKHSRGDRYLCIECENYLPVIMYVDEAECPICLEVKRSVKLPNCNHTSCIDCTKRCYYGSDAPSQMPQFPYPEIEALFFDELVSTMLTNLPNSNGDRDRWESCNNWHEKYPLIKKFQDDWDEWMESLNFKDDEDNLKKCPICRR